MKQSAILNAILGRASQYYPGTALLRQGLACATPRVNIFNERCTAPLHALYLQYTAASM